MASILRIAPALGLLAACAAPMPPDGGAQATRGPQGTLAAQRPATSPPGAEPGHCWGRDQTPAIFETVTEQRMIQPPEIGADGQVLARAIYRTETRQSLVQDRRDLLFRTPCEDELTPDLIASLQRALSLRGDYIGPVSGQMDRATRQAIRRFQRRQHGLDSGLLSLEAARSLGLLAYDFNQG